MDRKSPDRGDSLGEEWKTLAYCVEAELCRECDVVGRDGLPQPAYVGRGEGPRLGWVPLLPPPGWRRGTAEWTRMPID